MFLHLPLPRVVIEFEFIMLLITSASSESKSNPVLFITESPVINNMPLKEK